MSEPETKQYQSESFDFDANMEPAKLAFLILNYLYRNCYRIDSKYEDSESFVKVIQKLREKNVCPNFYKKGAPHEWKELVVEYHRTQVVPKHEFFGNEQAKSTKKRARPREEGLQSAKKRDGTKLSKWQLREALARKCFLTFFALRMAERVEELCAGKVKQNSQQTYKNNIFNMLTGKTHKKDGLFEKMRDICGKPNFATELRSSEWEEENQYPVDKQTSEIRFRNGQFNAAISYLKKDDGLDEFTKKIFKERPVDSLSDDAD